MPGRIPDTGGRYVRRIALCMELDDFYDHGIARGLVRYAKSRPDWRLYGYGWMFRPLEDLGSWQGEGIIARVEGPKDADRLAALGLPVVDVAGAYSRPGFRHVTNDDFLTGYKAAVSLRSRGFTHFAYVGVAEVAWSAERKAGFFAALARARGQIPRHPAQDRPVPVYERSLVWWEGRGRQDLFMEENRELARFLSAIEKPAALFACNDTAGLRVTELCRRLGIPVPEDLAILGVDNEDILCELSFPSLSSIMLDCESIGYRAGQLVDTILDGSGPPEGARITVPPREVAERESTLVIACSDPLVARAATYIRAHAHEGISVADIVSVAGCSRRSIETRFRRAMGHSLHDEILRSRLAAAKRTLASSSLPLDQVAERCGFGSLQRFHTAFRELEGCTPGQWRRRGAKAVHMF